jgi:superfamily II DNA or RNA helicase
MLKPLSGKDYLLAHDPLTGDNLEKYENRLTGTQVKLVNWTDQYSEREMARVMRRKTSVRTFLQSLTDEIIAKEIRPYIERRLLRCFDLLPGSDIPLYLKDTPERIYLQHEIHYANEPAEAVFNFHYRPADGLRYFLSVYYRGKEISLLNRRLIPLVSQPSVMVLDNNLLRFKDIDSKKLTPFVAKEHIAVPRRVEEQYFKTFVIENIRKFRTNVQGFTVVDEASVPVPVVSLENDLRYRPVMVLRFDYGHKTFHAATPSETEVSLNVHNEQYTVRRFRRDVEAEKARIDSLCSLGFYYAGNSMFYADKASALTTDTDDRQSLANLVEKLNVSSDALAAKGFRIDQHFFSQKYFTGAVQLEVELKSERDWFDVHAVVHFGGFSIPFINFRNHILRQDRNYVLPNGETLILPAEWMAKYAQAMLMAEYGTDILRLSKRYFTIVNDTFEGVDKKYIHSMIALCNVDEMELDDAPESIRATLRPYQLQGVTWLRVLHDHRLGGCLADDMGLGKTLQAITLLQSVLDDETRNIKSSLIVMPASLVHNWANEITRFAPHLKTLKYTGPDRQANADFGQYHIVLTTYGVLRNDSAILRKHHFLYAILDEAQYIRNPESVTYQAAMLIEADHYLTLSGTPVENTLTDLWAQMNFLNRGLLGDLNFFRTHFSTPVEKHHDETARTRLRRLVQPFLLRRTKQEVTPELPELTELVRYCEMTDVQRSLYEEEKSKIRNEIIESIEEQGVEKSGMLVLRALSRLRQLAIHPAMIHPAYEADSGKFDQIVESLDNLRSGGHQALLFSSFTKHLDLVAAHLQKENIPYAMLTGKTHNREEVIRRFNHGVPFFLISLKAGGVGLNLTAADYVFLLDPWWNPAAERQAVSRTHRIGQTEKVFAYRMITSGTIEEKILQLQEKKSALADILAQSANPFRGMTAEDVMELFE